MRAGGALQLLHLLHYDDAMSGRATGPKRTAFAAARAPAPGFPPPPVKRRGAPAWRSADRGSREEAGAQLEDTGAGASSYMGAEAAALLACVTATLLVLPLLLPPLPPPPPLFLLVPVAIFAVLLLFVLVPSDAANRAVAVGVGSSSFSSSSSSPYL